MVASSRWTSWWRRDRRDRPQAPGGDAAARLDLLLGAAGAGFPVAPAAHPAGHRCSCDRVGCPAPAQHPLSFAWQSQATTDAEQLERWLSRDPEANFVTATGRAHDVLDVPAEAGVLALERLEALGAVGPVAAVGADRYLFFTATRGTPQDEDEWWTSALDATPDTVSEHPGLRWHCRGSYTLVPPAALPGGSEVRWLRGPERPLPAG
ncbi:bifunctional DNA primase/polymerase [Kitasatospora phosalacinea]|uniref:bifunctional DNA primase/polymerase n=1 Tax=Kitasatospora phosalacinea TaxID=2065 RepID=UPI001FD78055|nr:bifunctional DNA primase/polymerase [Kitasatospora phosalacinea]